MKIAATISDCHQVGMDEWRDVNVTRVFDSSDSIDSMIAWAKTISQGHDFHSLKLSEVVDASPEEQT